MTEKEKMIKCELYDGTNDETLVNDRIKAKDLCYEYNQLKPSQVEQRIQKMKEILGNSKGEFWIEQPFMCDYGYHITIGKNFYANHNLVILDGNTVTFGDHVFIAPNCSFYTAGHPIEVETRNQMLEYAKPIVVGNNVWIGGNAVVLPGVTIGDNTVIGAGSVVTKDIPANVVAVGNPCRVIRKIKQ